MCPMTNYKNKKLAFLSGFFLCLLVLGIAIHKDYGISLDEPAQRLVGIANINYVSTTLGITSIVKHPHFSTFTTQTLMQLEDRHYGVIFELPAALLEVFFKTGDDAGIYHGRHLLTFIYFLFGLVAVYKLAKIRSGNWQTGLLTCAIIIFSPRIFADAFYNSKDIVFLSTYAIASLTMIQFLLNQTLGRALIHGLFTAIAIDTRLIAIIFPVITLFILWIECWRKNSSLEKSVVLSLTYLFTLTTLVIVFWPYMWSNPIDHFIEAFKYISRHPHSAAVLFLGKDVFTHELPWYYLPLWIGISTPILYLGLFFFGFCFTARKLAKEKFDMFHNNSLLIDVIFFILFLGPILAVAISHTSIYNGWRHLYFVYPFFALISTQGLFNIWQECKYNAPGRALISATIFLNFALIGHWMISNHPLQNLYFNALAGKNWSQSYESDYWGLANRLALIKILEVSTNPVINIWPGTSSKFKSGEPNVFSDQALLEPQFIRDRIKSPESIEDAEFVIASNNANYPSRYLASHGRFKKIDSVKVDGNEILSIFHQRQHANPSTPRKGEVLLFSNDSEGIFYLYGNKNPPINWEIWNSKEWHAPESWGAWSKGLYSSIEIPTQNEKPEKISIRMRGFTSPKNLTQSAQIWINGKFIEKIILSGDNGQEFIYLIPSEVDFKDRIKIELKELQPLSPKKLGLNNDNRDIAIGLEAITLF